MTKPLPVGFNDICSLVTDGTHDSPKLLPEGVPFIKGKHISSGQIDFENCDYISEQDHQLCIKRVKPQADDILMSNIGSIGDTVRVGVDREFSIKNVALLRPDPNKADPLFVFYLMKDKAFKERLLVTSQKLSERSVTEPVAPPCRRGSGQGWSLLQPQSLIHAFPCPSRGCPAAIAGFQGLEKKVVSASFFCCRYLIGIFTYHYEYSTDHDNREKKASPQAGGHGGRATIHHGVADKDSSQMR